MIDLAQHLPELKDMLNRSLRGDITIEVAVPEQSCAVKVDPSELELALLNLAVNARDAMPNGGALRITAEPVALDGKPAEDGLRGEFVAIRVADTGSGIAARGSAARVRAVLHHQGGGQRHRAWAEPGLRLRQAVRRRRDHRQHGRPRHGRSRSICRARRICRRLRSRPPERESRAAARRHGACWWRTSAEVAEVASAYFQQLGYMVKQVASANAALELIGNDPKIDLVFSDVLMPGGMNGLELGQRSAGAIPAIPVLLATGYSDGMRDARRAGLCRAAKAVRSRRPRAGVARGARPRSRADNARGGLVAGATR